VDFWTETLMLFKERVEAYEKKLVEKDYMVDEEDAIANPDEGKDALTMFKE